MSWELPALGTMSSMLFMLLLAMKWKLPSLPALAGAAAASVAAALVFLWVYPLCRIDWGLTSTVAGEFLRVTPRGLTVTRTR